MCQAAGFVIIVYWNDREISYRHLLASNDILEKRSKFQKQNRNVEALLFSLRQSRDVTIKVSLYI